MKLTRPECFFLAVIAAVAIWSGIAPLDRAVWCAEMVTPVLLLIALAVLWRRFRFSTLSYGILTFWFVLQLIGAHYSFEKVPFEWVQEWFGFERNHYDRVAHFAVGLFAWPAAEWFHRRQWAPTPALAAFFGAAVIVAVAGLWELVEWGYAEWEGGDLGAAFLGSQGDIWDAQKDILMDTLGALLAASAYVLTFKGKKHDLQRD